MIVGLIPARGGSKGIEDKNIQVIDNWTLLSLGIRKLFLAGCEKVLVSSDSKTILEMAEANGALPIFRSPQSSMDTAPTSAVINEILSSGVIAENDICILHQVTSPLLFVSSIRSVISQLSNDLRLTSSLTVLEKQIHIWQRNSKDSFWAPGYNEGQRVPRQLSEKMGYETGGAYGFRVDGYPFEFGISRPPTTTVPIDWIESLDIDVIEELELARKLFSIFSAKILFNS